MSTLPKRQPEGIPAGGQFASATHSEPGITLRSPASTALPPLSKERLAEAHRKLQEASGGVVGISTS